MSTVDRESYRERSSRSKWLREKEKSGRLLDMTGRKLSDTEDVEELTSALTAASRDSEKEKTGLHSPIKSSRGDGSRPATKPESTCH